MFASIKVTAWPCSAEVPDGPNAADDLNDDIVEFENARKYQFYGVVMTPMIQMAQGRQMTLHDDLVNI